MRGATEGGGVEIDACGRVEEEELLLVGGGAPPPLVLLRGGGRRELPPLLHDVHHPVGADGEGKIRLLGLWGGGEKRAPLKRGGGERAEHRPREATGGGGGLRGVVQPREGEIGNARAETRQETPDVPRAPHRDHGDTLRGQDASPPRGERLERTSVADSLDEDDGARGRSHRVTAWRRTGSDTPFSSTAPTGSKAIPSGTRDPRSPA